MARGFRWFEPMLTGMAAIAAMPGTAQAADMPAAITCEASAMHWNTQRLSDTGFTRIHAKVKVKTVVDASPVIVLQQRTPAGERLDFILVANTPPMPGTPGLPLFNIYIAQTGKDSASVRSSDKALFFSSEFDLTLTRDAAGKARIDVRWDLAQGSDARGVVLEGAAFPSAPVALMCASGTYELTDLSIE